MRERLSPKLGQWLPVVVVAVTAVVLAATSISEVFIARAISATEAEQGGPVEAGLADRCSTPMGQQDLTQRGPAYTASRSNAGSFLLLRHSADCGPI